MGKTYTIRSAADLGRTVGELRRDRGLTQAEVAEANGLSRPWLAQLEAGRSSAILEHLLRLLRRMGATVTVTWDDDRG